MQKDYTEVALMNIYTYDEIRVDHCVIGEPATLLVMNYEDGIERPVMTPSPVVSMSIGDAKHVCIETELSIIQTNTMNIMTI